MTVRCEENKGLDRSKNFGEVNSSGEFAPELNQEANVALVFLFAGCVFKRGSAAESRTLSNSYGGE